MVKSHSNVRLGPKLASAAQLRNIKSEQYLATTLEQPHNNMDSTMDTTIGGMQQHFARMYNRRNFIVNGSFGERSMHFTRRIGRIADAKRKNEKMPDRLARGVCYFMSLVNYFGDHLSLVYGLMEKFPKYGCLYCGKKPCACTDASRPDPTEYTVCDEQWEWSFGRWQLHFQEVYGHYNAGKFEKVFMRLSSEFGEFGILNAKGPKTPITPMAILTECRREAADVFNWLLTLAYVQDIDLEAEVVMRYTVCPGCGLQVCDCPVVSVSNDGEHFSTVHVPSLV